jgi:pSer/pThr/pTyr-binding forkhead associated (FHA) protein
MCGSHTKRQTKARLLLNCEGVDLPPHELFGDIIMIGRAPANHIVIQHLTVSAQHALLLRVGDCYWLKDLNSTNGTQINGVFVAEAELEDGDTIRFGSVIAFFAGNSCKRTRARIRKFFKNFQSNPEANTRCNFLNQRISAK